MRLPAVTAAMLAALVLAGCGGGSPGVQISYLSFIEQVEAGNVKSISAAGRAIQGTFKHQITYPPTSHVKSVRFSAQLPAFAPIRPLVRLLEKERVRITGRPPSR